MLDGIILAYPLKYFYLYQMLKKKKKKLREGRRQQQKHVHGDIDDQERMID